MALEFIRRVNATLGLALAATAVFNYPTPAMLAAQILKRLGLDKMEGPDAAAEATAWPEPARLEDETHGRVTGADSSRNGSEPRVEISDDEALRALLEPGDARYGD